MTIAPSPYDWEPTQRLNRQPSHPQHVSHIRDLPTLQVHQIYSYATRMMNTSPEGSAKEAYYRRMRNIAIEQLEVRQDNIAKNWRDSFGSWPE